MHAPATPANTQHTQGCRRPWRGIDSQLTSSTSILSKPTGPSDDLTMLAIAVAAVTFCVRTSLRHQRAAGDRPNTRVHSKGSNEREERERHLNRNRRGLVFACAPLRLQGGWGRGVRVSRQVLNGDRVGLVSEVLFRESKARSL